MIALPVLSAGMSAAVAIDDEWAVDGMRRLAVEGVQAGVTGVAGFAGLLAVLGEDSALRAQAFGRKARVLVICTEGRAADPGGYDRLVGGDVAGG